MILLQKMFSVELYVRYVFDFGSLDMYDLQLLEINDSFNSF